MMTLLAYCPCNVAREVHKTASETGDTSKQDTWACTKVFQFCLQKAASAHVGLHASIHPIDDPPLDHHHHLHFP